jgi:Flp pilus assembly protein TadG
MSSSLPAKASRRRGAAVVEFALVGSLLVLLIFGMIELGRAIMVLQLLNNAARHGCREGALPEKSTNDIGVAVGTFLEDAGIANAHITVRVNDADGEASTADTGDAISVSVSVSASDISWLPSARYLGNMQLASTVVMRRE